MLPVIRGRQKIRCQIVGRVLLHGDLLEHDPLFPLHLLGIEQGLKQQVGEDLHGKIEVVGG